jgi:hypothetical protein
MAKSRTSGQGRPKGCLNKTTAALKEIAQEFGAPSLLRLARLAGIIDGIVGAENEAVQVSAMRELLDRGYGKPAQTIGADRDNPLFPKITVLFGDQDDPEEAG